MRWVDPPIVPDGYESDRRELRDAHGLRKPRSPPPASCYRYECHASRPHEEIDIRAHRHPSGGASVSDHGPGQEQESFHDVGREVQQVHYLTDPCPTHVPQPADVRLVPDHARPDRPLVPDRQRQQPGDPGDPRLFPRRECFPHRHERLHGGRQLRLVHPAPVSGSGRRFREIPLGSIRVDSAPSTRPAVSLGEIPGWLVMVKRTVRRAPRKGAVPLRPQRTRRRSGVRPAEAAPLRGHGGSEALALRCPP